MAAKTKMVKLISRDDERVEKTEEEAAVLLDWLEKKGKAGLWKRDTSKEDKKGTKSKDD